jgi:hypothetical protein
MVTNNCQNLQTLLPGRIKRRVASKAVSAALIASALEPETGPLAPTTMVVATVEQ